MVGRENGYQGPVKIQLLKGAVLLSKLLVISFFSLKDLTLILRILNGLVRGG